MKNKILIGMSVVLISSGLYATDKIGKVDFNKYPLSKTLTSQSRGGDLPDKLAATDGIGSLMLKRVGKNNNKIDNSAYNKLLNENLSKLDDNNSLNDLIVKGKISIPTDKLKKINDNEFQETIIPGAIGKVGNFWYSKPYYPGVTYIKYALAKAKSLCTALGDGWRLPTKIEAEENYIATNNIFVWTSYQYKTGGGTSDIFFKYDNNKVFSTKGLNAGYSYHINYPSICIKEID